MLALILKIIMGLIDALPIIDKLVTAAAKARVDHAAEQERLTKDARNAAAIAAAQNPVEKPVEKPNP